MKKTLTLDDKSPWSYAIDDPIRTIEGAVIEIGDWIGRGGYGAVYNCVDAVSGEELAVKFLLHPDTTLHARFGREIALLKDLDNVHIIKFKGSGSLTAEVRNRKSRRNTVVPFVIMELADCNLSEVMLTRRAGFPYEDYAGQFRGLSAALATLHAVAIHRDIKPENILIRGGRWLLSDYGLCSFVDPTLPDLTGENERVGPKFWLSPEAQNRMLKSPDEITRASDVFQLAAVFWYAATGRHPMGNITQTDWPGPERLFGVLQASLMHDSAKRPQTGQELLDAIQAGMEP